MKKGFTLIELLAVIVILAIIALIATPIVLNIINNAKESATVRGADFYISALQNEIALENMKQGGSFNPSRCIIDEEDKNLYCDGKPIDIKVDGEKPLEGSEIIFTEGKVTSVNLIYPSGTVTQNSEGELVLGEGKESEPEKKLKDLATVSNNLGITSVHECASSGSCEPGTAFAIKVNDEDTYKFYVLNEEAGKVNLIMSNNLLNSVGYYDEECTKIYYEDEYFYKECPDINYTKGPISALRALKEATANWTNIEKYSYTLDFGIGIYSGEYVQNIRARLPKILDFTVESIGCTEYGETCPSWVYSDLTNSHWLTDAYNEYSVGFLDMSTGTLVTQEMISIDTEQAIRPIITIKK